MMKPSQGTHVLWQHIRYRTDEKHYELAKSPNNEMLGISDVVGPRPLRTRASKNMIMFEWSVGAQPKSDI